MLIETSVAKKLLSQFHQFFGLLSRLLFVANLLTLELTGK